MLPVFLSSDLTQILTIRSTSPSIYVGYDLASADDFCGVRTVNDSTIAMTATVSWNPTDLSTLMWKADDGDFTTWFPFELDNYVRRWEDPWCAEDSKWIAFFGGYMATKTFDGVEYNDLVCWPLLAAPSQYDKFHTGLAGCVPDPLGALDPPMAFTAHAPLSATTTAQPLPTWSSHPKPTSRGVVLSPAKTTSSPPRGTQGPQPPQPPQPQHDGGVQGPKAPQNPSDPQLPSNGQDPSNNPKDPNQGTPGRTPPKFPATITVGNSAFPFQIRPSAGATPPALIIGTNTVAAGGPEVTIANVPISLSTDGVLSFNGRTVTIPNSVFSGTDAAGDSGGVEHSSSAESSTGDPTNSNSADGGSSDGSSSGSSSDEYGSSTGDPGAGDQPGDDPSRTDNGNSNPDEQPSIPGTSATAASFRGTTQDQQNSAIFLTQTRMSWISWALAFSLIYFTLT